jgi:tetratricopeptide (TPR) repeat protein
MRQRVKPILPAGALMALVLAVAFCKPLIASPLQGMDNETLESYTTAEFQRGAWSLQVPARAVYREAMEKLEAGDREAARRKLFLAASLSGDYPDPMFALARIELRSGNSDFIIHLIEGYKRKIRGFYGQALLAVNLVILSAAVSFTVLFLALIFLLVRHWPEYDHKIREIYGGKYAFPPARFIGPLVILGMLILRGGIALYSALMITVLWPFIDRREKAAVLTAVLFIGAVSFLAPRLESLTSAIDEGSATRRFAMVNERGADHRLIRSVEEIDDSRFYAEKEFALGTMKSRMGLYDEARDHLLASVAERGDFAPAYLNLGNVYFRQGDFNRALAGYQSVIAIDSTCAIAWFNIGQTYINKMLFAESSEALAKAREFGIERHNEANPATALLEFDIYDRGFPAGELWSIALREGPPRGSGIIDGIFRPYLLFPLRWVWIALITAIIAGTFLAMTIPRSWTVYSCNNCSLPTCSECSDSETGITLCHNCAAAIGGLSSVKVMEALLRHRRQKIRSRKGGGGWWKMRVIPGSSKIMLGSAWKGMMVMAVASSALFMLMWNGFYLGDPRSAALGTPIIQQIVAAAVIALCWLSTLRSRKPREQINYRILPSNYRIEKPEVKKEAAPRTLDLEDAPAEPAAAESAPEPAQPERRRFTEQDNKARDAFKEYLETL